MRYSNFFFIDTATTEIYTLSLHDALPIWRRRPSPPCSPVRLFRTAFGKVELRSEEHTSESSHVSISYAVFCLKKKNTTELNELSALAAHSTSKDSLFHFAGVDYFLYPAVF